MECLSIIVIIVRLSEYGGMECLSIIVILNMVEWETFIYYCNGMEMFIYYCNSEYGGIGMGTFIYCNIVILNMVGWKCLSTIVIKYGGMGTFIYYCNSEYGGMEMFIYYCNSEYGGIERLSIIVNLNMIVYLLL